jgi:hypothetical protein
MRRSASSARTSQAVRGTKASRCVHGRGLRAIRTGGDLGAPSTGEVPDFSLYADGLFVAHDADGVPLSVRRMRPLLPDERGCEDLFEVEPV